LGTAATQASTAFDAAGKADGLVPIGSVTMYAGFPAPNGSWALCDGSAVSRTTYATLFGVIGTTYGPGDGSTTFNLPNLVGKFAKFGDVGSLPPGGTGGATTHNHPLSGNGQALVRATLGGTVHSFSVTTTGGSWTSNAAMSGSTLATATLNTGAALNGFTDSGGTLPPYLNLTFIIRVL
jgi:microcystin-dependent protein